VLDQGDDDGVEDHRFLRRRLLACQLEKGEVAEIHVAEDFVWQIEAANGDRVPAAPGDVRGDVFGPFRHVRSLA